MTAVYRGSARQRTKTDRKVTMLTTETSVAEPRRRRCQLCGPDLRYREAASVTAAMPSPAPGSLSISSGARPGQSAASIGSALDIDQVINGRTRECDSRLRLRYEGGGCLSIQMGMPSAPCAPSTAGMWSPHICQMTLLRGLAFRAWQPQHTCATPSGLSHDRSLVSVSPDHQRARPGSEGRPQVTTSERSHAAIDLA